MSLRKSIENHLIVKYLKNKFRAKERQLAKHAPWIKRQHLTKIVKGHCNVLIASLLNEEQKFSFREKKFIIDKILDFCFEKGLSNLKVNSKIKEIKPLLHINSYIIYEEFLKGIQENKNTKNINFNINKELTLVQEKIAKSNCVEEILDEKIGAA